MTLENIETIVLSMIGYDRYSSLSVDTDAEKIEDFALIHQCVHLARNEIKFYTTIPSIIKEDTTIVTVVGTKTYSLPTDFDVPVKIIYVSTSSQWPLTQLYLENILQKKSNITAQGTPDSYMILGNVADVIQMKLYDTPNVAGDTLYVYYKPILANLTTSTDEDVLLQKYPETIIKFATAFAFQLIKKDSANFDKYYAMGFSDLSAIRQREGSADFTGKGLPDALTRARRMNRHSR